MSRYCNFCDKAYFGLIELIDHIRTRHTGERPFTCASCPQSYPSKDSLRKHLAKSHRNLQQVPKSGQRPFQCSDCSKSFKFATGLASHQQHRCLGGVTLVCSYCEKSYHSSIGLNEHMIVHTGEKPFKCPDCGRKFPRHHNLALHKKMVHVDPPTVPVTIKSHACSVCGKTFAARNSLVKHQIFHSNERPHSCDRCEKAFKDRGSLRRHIQGHEHAEGSSTSSVSCPLCQRSFSRRTLLTIHMSAHTKEKPHTCSISACDHQFSTAFHLRRHHRVVHLGEKPHICPSCGKAFGEKGNLTMHLRTHSEVKPFSCDGGCEKRFNSVAEVRVHMRIHTGEKPYSCKGCGKRYRSQGSLIYHMKKCHDHDPEESKKVIYKHKPKSTSADKSSKLQTRELRVVLPTLRLPPNVMLLLANTNSS